MQDAINELKALGASFIEIDLPREALHSAYYTIALYEHRLILRDSTALYMAIDASKQHD